MATQIRYFGIRHHGAGSARRLTNALGEFKPDLIAMEIPAESVPLIHQLQSVAHQCPVAFVYYNPDNIRETTYYPLAEYSPEYQAIVYAGEHQIVIHPLDIPAGLKTWHRSLEKSETGGLSADQHRMINDPIAYLARRSGYEDSERWWESYFESWHDALDLFDVIADLMLQLRLQSAGLDDRVTIIREHYMRRELDLCIKKNPQRLAVICGAWHVPALIPDSGVPVPPMNIDLLSSKKMKTGIIPWTNRRLALNASYTAGIVAPQWSECMFENHSNAVNLWLTRAARMMREYGFDVNTAELIDTARLATELALLRELPTPGIMELQDACITILGKGDASRISLIMNELLIGQRTGSIEISASTLSLVTEFKNQLKAFRLNKYWMENPPEMLQLDLRKEKHLLISRFLHQSTLLQLLWCEEESVSVQALGNFHENWRFQWEPDCEIRLTEAAIEGSDIQTAILKISERLWTETKDLLALGHWINHGLKADMPELWNLISTRLHDLSVSDNSLIDLAELIRPLVSSISYGNIHQMDVAQLEKILDDIIPHIILEFPSQSALIKSDEAQKLLRCMDLIQSFFYHFSKNDHLDLWISTLNLASTQVNIHPKIRGRIWYLCLEQKWTSRELFVVELNHIFSKSARINDTAEWIEGFLHQSTGFYLFQENALQNMQQWISALEEQEFREVLPVLRRSFGSLQMTERQRILRMITRNTGKKITQQSGRVLHPERDAIIMKMLQRIFTPAVWPDAVNPDA
ncbi:MAG: DUF5682 family protein [Saprospiraceae bacterium]